MSHTEDPVASTAPDALLHVTPEGPYAGANLTLTFAARCPRGCDLKGERVTLSDAAGQAIGDLELTTFDGKYFVTDGATARAPLTPGPITYRASLPAHIKDGASHPEIKAETTVEVKAHDLSLRAWGVPSAITVGETFRFHVGMKCFAECELAGREVVVVDGTGAVVASATMLATPWKGTKALYYAEVAAQAPVDAGDHYWEVKTGVDGTVAPHVPAAANFLVRVVAAPDVEVTVKAIDHETREPIKGLHVQLHPYRAFTDEEGVARIKVRKGDYQLFVTGLAYVGHREPLEVSEDVTVTAELVVEKEFDPYDVMV